MKRLLCLISSMNTGGAETFLMKQYRQLDRTKYQMDFCVNVPEKGFYDDEILSMGGKIFRIPSKSADAVGFVNALSDLVRTEKYEYVLRITSNAAGFLDLKIAKDAGAKVCIARSSNSSDGESRTAKLVHFAGRILYSKYVDVKIAPSDLAAKYTFGKKAVAKGMVRPLHNAIDLDVYRFHQADRDAIRAEWNLEDKFVVGHIGRFNHQKNHMFLLEIFREISLLQENARLVLVGKGELEQQIREKADHLGIADKVIFTGIRSDIPRLLSAMDVFVFPSFYEGMPNTVIEAQATGLPCIIADTITKEANITSLVEYFPLSLSSTAWAQKAIDASRTDRKDTTQDFIDHKYDIQSAANEFVRLCFGE